MKIRTQLIINLIFSGIVLIIISTMMIATEQEVDRLNRQVELAKKIEIKAGELGYLSSDYLLHQESQQINRWQLKFSSLSNDLSGLTVGGPQQQAIVSNIKANQQSLKQIFDDVISNIEDVNQNQPGAVGMTLVRVSWSRMAIRNQAMVSDASRLSQMLREEAKRLEQTRNLLVFILTGSFIAFLLLDHMVIFGRTLKSITKLQAGITIVGSGNLDYSIEEMGNDEIGELTQAFNQMARKLKTVTASRTQLEGEITERLRAEEALRQFNAELEQRVAAQTAEIIEANAELEQRIAARTSEIQAANKELQAARLAALNLMEDALGAQEQVKQVNARLRESEQRLSRAQEIAHLGGWELDLMNDRLTWSDEVYRIFGLQPQEFAATYEAFLEAIHPEDRAAVDAAYSGSVREGRNNYEIEHRVVKRSNGEVRIVHEKCEHFRNEAGQIVRSVGMVHDITERKQAEEALRLARDELELRVQERTEELATANRELVKEIAERKEVERQLRIQTTAMEAAANGIVITDRQGNIQWTNPALNQISGYDAHDLIGQSTHIFKSGQHDADYYRQMWDTILSGQVWRGETTNRRKDGSLYVEEQTITPVHDENGEIPHFIAIKQDITDRKQAEEELERRNVELQAISSAEHEQRQLSEALVEAALILNKSLKLDDVLAHILEQIKEVIPYQLAEIALLEGESFYNASHQGDWGWPESLAGIKSRLPLEDFPLMNKMIQTGQPVLILDTRKEPDWIILEGLESSRSFLSAPLLVEEKVIGFVNLFAGQPSFFTKEMRDRLAAFAAHAAVAIQNAWLFEQARASSERLQSLSRRLVEIQESERLYISRELHDEAGQILTSMMLDLRFLEKKAAQPDIVLEKVVEMERSLNEVLKNLHRVAMALRPASLDHLGLVAALRQHVESLGEKHGLKVSFRSGNVRKRLPTNVETVLYRIVQEALTNVVRHAQASRVDVVLTVRDDKLIVIVEDDGIGFDPDAVSTSDHLGLFGMRERTEMIDGRLVIESAPRKGTTIMMEVGYADTIIDRR